MRHLKIFFFLFIFTFVSTSHAIQINVKSSSKEVSALGFTVNGKNHGGAGKSYLASNMPAGTYEFGVRVNGLFGTDVPCSYHSKKEIQLNKDTMAILNYDGQACTMFIK